MRRIEISTPFENERGKRDGRHVAATSADGEPGMRPSENR